MGFKVELAAYDDEANPDKGVANAKQIVADPAFCAWWVTTTLACRSPHLRCTTPSGLANVSPANTNPRVTDRGYAEVSRLVGRDDIQGAVGAQFAKSKGMTTAYVLHDKTAYGQGIAEFFQARSRSPGHQGAGI
jgi:branched-chain amino acid transport system substrate-binding protein